VNETIEPENQNAVLSVAEAADESAVKGELADPAVESVERELWMRGTGRSSSRRPVVIGGTGFNVSQKAIELAREAFETTDIRFVLEEEEDELDHESVTETKAWVTATRRALEFAEKMDGNLDFDAKPLRVDRPKKPAAWRIALLKFYTLQRLSCLCFEDWDSEFAEASIILDLIFAPAITGTYGPLPDGDSPLANGASIGILRNAVLKGGRLGGKQQAVRDFAEHLLAVGCDPIVAEGLLDGWAHYWDDGSYQGVHSVHLMLAEIAKRLVREKEGPV
jgi:hypothetical protein